MTRNQNDYTGFTEGQFAADEYFQLWVLGGDPAAGQFWESYLLLHPGQREAMIHACGLLKDLAANRYPVPALSAEEKITIKRNIYQSLNLPFASAPSSSFFYGRKKKWGQWSAVAALALVFLALSFLIRSGMISAWEGKNNNSALLLKTGAEEMKRIVLEDSTVVILNANSSLRCGSNFQNGSRREVFLEGNAFFRVEKDLRHTPFIVHAGSLVVTVLGTELNVNARSKAVEVELASGKVKVEEERSKKDVIYLQPGEKVKPDADGKSFIKTEMNPELYSAWTEGEWKFRQTTLEEITGLLHEYYGVGIVFTNERSRRLRINAVIPVTSLRKLIPVIEQTLQIKMQLINDQLILQ